MNCRVCSAEVPEGSRYCLNCGATLSDSATPRPTVDGFALIKNYIPPELARKILNAGKQIESERRHVTVLFADVVGFTALSEKMDVELVSTILNDCFRGLISTILKYEGTIDKFIGDGIMAIFGAPLAHQNAPRAAPWTCSRISSGSTTRQRSSFRHVSVSTSAFTPGWSSPEMWGAISA